MPGTWRGVSRIIHAQEPPTAALLAMSQLPTALASDPLCSAPVGEGAKRPVMGMEGDMGRTFRGTSLVIFVPSCEDGVLGYDRYEQQCSATAGTFIRKTALAGIWNDSPACTVFQQLSPLHLPFRGAGEEFHDLGCCG